MPTDGYAKSRAPGATNFGGAAHPEHDARYDRADEFVEVVLGHWDSWEDDAIVLDRPGGVFADPAKVHRARTSACRGPAGVSGCARADRRVVATRRNTNTAPQDRDSRAR